MIRFFNKDINFDFKNKPLFKKWIKSIVEEKNCRVGDINIIFCNDESILEINRDYLGHDYYTDIITFDYTSGNLLSGELYISIDTVKANSVEYNSSFPDELHRVIIHGILHLCGLDDHSESDIKSMRKAEDDALVLLASMM